MSPADIVCHYQCPQRIIFVITLKPDGMPNIMPAGWSMVASLTPPRFAVSVGHSRYTHELVLARREFVLAFPSTGMADAVNYHGSCSGRDVDKSAYPGTIFVPSTHIETPMLQEAVVNLECKLESATIAGDHTIFVGDVVGATATSDGRRGLMEWHNGPICSP